MRVKNSRYTVRKLGLKFLKYILQVYTPEEREARCPTVSGREV